MPIKTLAKAKLSQRELLRTSMGLAREHEQLIADYNVLAQRARLLAGAVAYLMHERDPHRIDVRVPAGVYREDCHLGAEIEATTGDVIVVRDAYLFKDSNEVTP